MTLGFSLFTSLQLRFHGIPPTSRQRSWNFWGSGDRFPTIRQPIASESFKNWWDSSKIGDRRESISFHFNITCSFRDWIFLDFRIGEIENQRFSSSNSRWSYFSSFLAKLRLASQAKSTFRGGYALAFWCEATSFYRLSYASAFWGEASLPYRRGYASAFWGEASLPCKRIYVLAFWGKASSARHNYRLFACLFYSSTTCLPLLSCSTLRTGAIN